MDQPEKGKKGGRKVDPRRQPDETFREESSDPERYEREHRFSTESHRWSDEEAATEEREYPPEGEQGVAEKGEPKK